MKPQRSQRNTLCPQKNTSCRKMSEEHKQTHRMKPEHTLINLALGLRR